MDTFAAKPARKRKLAEIVYGRILEEILSGKIVPGDKLPSEAALSTALDVSRPVTREALMRLQADGLIRTHKGVGTFVTRRPQSRLTELAESSEVSGYLLSLEPRIVLEVEAARLAACRRTPAQLSAIRMANDALREEIGRGNLGQKEDVAFHERIALAAGNENFSKLLKSISKPVVQTIAIGLELGRQQNSGRRSRVVDEHNSIVNAIADQDSEAASAFMRYHLLKARAALIDMRHIAEPQYDED